MAGATTSEPAGAGMEDADMTRKLGEKRTRRPRIGLATALVVGAFMIAMLATGAAQARPAELPGPADVEGDLGTYAPVSLKADLPFVDAPSADSRPGRLRSLHADQRADRLLLRIGLAETGSHRENLSLFRDGRMRVYVLLDYADGGATGMPDGLKGDAPLRWDAAVRLGHDGDALEASGFLCGRSEPARGFVRGVVTVTGSRAIECSLNLPAAFRAATIAAADAHWSEYERIAADMAGRDATPVAYHVVSVVDGEPVDAISATNEPQSGRRVGATGETRNARSESVLRQNAPNPFNPKTTLSFVVAGGAATRAVLEVYDLAGRLVITLVDLELEPGDHSVVWRGCDREGRRVASGVYFARLSVDGETDTRRMIMLK
jgi:hypothetical protein